MNYTEDNRNNRRDAKRGRRYKPVKTGLPKGFTKSEWFAMKNGRPSDDARPLSFTFC